MLGCYRGVSDRPPPPARITIEHITADRVAQYPPPSWLQYPHCHPNLPGRWLHPRGGGYHMGDQRTLPETVRRSVWHAGRTPSLLYGSGNQRVFPGRDPGSEGRTDHIWSVTGQRPPRGMHISDCRASPQGKKGVPGYYNGQGIMEYRVTDSRHVDSMQVPHEAITAVHVGGSKNELFRAIKLDCGFCE